MTSSLRFLSVFILSLLAPFSIQATIFTVTNTADTGPGSLRGHITQAQPNDTIRFSIHGTIFLDSTIWLTKNLHIQGPGPDKIIVDGKQLSRLFRIQQGDTLHFSGMTFQNGNGIEDTSRAVSGGAFINEGFLILRNAIFYKNIAKNGGAIENAGYASNAELDMAFCTFYENRAIEVNDTI
ncbi:MAG: hypothetical protein KDD99_05300, partial [Bacteroidetes bacterium]|nr:hypothetical protein [Bacteroidota bacterium]